ncbi:ABC transporter transmembrane domain-containing protein, partial [Pseudomonas aeruginosa]
LGTAAILVWMHWQLALLILLFNPLVIWSTVQLGKRVKHLKKLENDSTARFTQALTETLEAAEEIALAIAGADFLDRLEGLGERLGEAPGAVALERLEVLDALAQLYRRPHNQ